MIKEDEEQRMDVKSVSVFVSGQTPLSPPGKALVSQNSGSSPPLGREVPSDLCSPCSPKCNDIVRNLEMCIHNQEQRIAELQNHLQTMYEELSIVKQEMRKRKDVKHSVSKEAFAASVSKEAFAASASKEAFAASASKEAFAASVSVSKETFAASDKTKKPS
jgi:regulator of replication initiation timing